MVANVCIVVETVGLPIAFCMALVPGLESCLILCAVFCLICSFCMLHNNFVHVVWHVVVACVSCFKMSAVSVCEGAALEHDPKAPDWTGFMKHVRRDFDGGMVPDVVLPEPPINLDPVTEEATLASLDRADFRRKQMGADFIFVTVDGGEYWRLAQVHRWHS